MKKYESPEMKIVEVDEKILTADDGGITVTGDIIEGPDGSGGSGDDSFGWPM